MIALIAWIAPQKLPSPVGVSHCTQMLVVAEFGRPVRPNVKSSTRHVTPPGSLIVREVNMANFIAGARRRAVLD